MVGNALIYDNRGRLIKQVLNNELLSASGEFTWDGVNEYGQKGSIGIYLVYFELFILLICKENRFFGGL